MDVVNDAVINLQGNVHIDENPDAGMVVEMRIPVSLLTNHSVLVSAGDERFAVPTNTREQIFTPGAGRLDKIGSDLSFIIDKMSYRVDNFTSLVGMPVDELNANGEPFYQPVLLVRVDDQLIAVVVDSVDTTLELVVKGCGKYVGEVNGVTGMSLLGNGQVLPVIDIPQLIRGVVPVAKAKVSRMSTSKLKAKITKILIVDDSLSARNSLAELAKDAGYKATLARDGIEALNLLGSEIPDLVLTDLEMPRMNGLELTSSIRSDSKISHLPIVMVTSRTTQKHKEQALSSGVNDYVTKPYTPEEMMNVVIQHLKHLQEGGA